MPLAIGKKVIAEKTSSGLSWRKLVQWQASGLPLLGAVGAAAEFQRSAAWLLKNMDFGFAPILLFWFLALGAVGHMAIVFYLLITRAPDARDHLMGLIGFLGVVAFVGMYNYKVFYLDEGIWGASLSGDAAQVKVLLERGADPEAKGEGGTTALEAAEARGHEEVVKLLKDAGAEK